MIITDEFAAILLAILAVSVLILLAIAGTGLFLAARGRWVIGGVLVAAVLGFVFRPNLIDRARNAAVTRPFEARSTIPDTLDLSGQRVLFIETGGTICGEFCGDVVQLGTDIDAHWVGIGGSIPDVFTDNPLRDVMDSAEYVQRIALGPPNDDPLDQRFAEAISGGHMPPYDTVIVFDDSGLVPFIAPHLLGPPVPDRVQVQTSVLVFTDWPDPYAAPPPAPTYRSVLGRVTERRILLWPVAVHDRFIPHFDDVDAQWRAAVCPFAGTPADRDVFTYGYLCDPDSLNALFD